MASARWRRVAAAAAALALALALVGLAAVSWPAAATASSASELRSLGLATRGFASADVPPVNGTRMLAKVVGTEFHVRRKLPGGGFSDTFEPMGFMPGINIGASKPFHDPGELPLHYDDYMRLFNYCKSLNLHIIRVYTVQGPDFYRAIVDWNTAAAPEDVIYFFQGVWTPEEEMEGHDGKGADVFTPSIFDAMTDFVERTVRALHGDGLVRYLAPGEPLGDYQADAAPWCIGWVLGTEWYPHTVYMTLSGRGVGVPLHRGEYVETTDDAHVFENWIALMMEQLLKRDMDFGGWQRPVAFTNWITTDPLHHTLEPGPDIGSHEDWMSVDAHHLRVTAKWRAGYFVNFHAYPYYPDFLKYPLNWYNTSWEFADGFEIEDPYQLYLRRLRYHFEGYPLIISEVGIPTSLGTSQIGYKGRWHGHMTERQQAEVVVDMISFMVEYGYAGVFVFELLDEWFKKNWNTLRADRNRKAWHNALSSEQWYGLLATEDQGPITIDGRFDDWEDARRLPYTAQQETQFARVMVAHGADYLSLLLVKADGQPWTAEDHLLIGFDSDSTGGSHTGDIFPGVRFAQPADRLLRYLNGTMEMFVYSYFSIFNRHYKHSGHALVLEYDDVPCDWITDPNSNRWEPWDLIVKYSTYVNTKPQLTYKPHEIFTIPFQEGTTDAADPDFNNFAMFSRRGPMLELRIPWMLLGYSDPSNHELYAFDGCFYDFTYVYRNTTEDLYIEPVLASAAHPLYRSSEFLAGGREQLQAMGTVFEVDRAPYYYWANWTGGCYCERYKQHAGLLGSFFGAIRGIPLGANYTWDGQPYMFPLTPLFCECSYEYLTLGDFQSYLVFASIVFIYLNILWVGAVRPLLMLVINLWTPVKTHSNWLLMLTATFLSIVLPLIVAAVYYATVGADSRRVSVVDMIRQEFIITGDKDKSPDYWIYMIYVFLSANWDGILLAIAMCCVRWKQLTEEVIQKRLHMSKRTKVLTHALLEMYHNDFDPDAPIPDMDTDEHMIDEHAADEEAGEHHRRTAAGGRGALAWVGARLRRASNLARDWVGLGPVPASAVRSGGAGAGTSALLRVNTDSTDLSAVAESKPPSGGGGVAPKPADDDGDGDGANRRSRTVSGPAHSTSAISSASTAQSAITDSGAGADPAPAAAAAYAGAVSRVRYPSNLVPRPAAAAAAAAVQQQEHMSPALSSARASIPTSPHSRVASGRSVRSGGYPVAADAAAATAHLRTASQHSRFSAFSGATDGGAGAGAGAGAGRVRQPSQLSTFSTMSGGPPILQPDPNDPIHTISPDDTPEMLAKKAYVQMHRNAMMQAYVASQMAAADEAAGPADLAAGARSRMASHRSDRAVAPRGRTASQRGILASARARTASGRVPLPPLIEEDEEEDSGDVGSVFVQPPAALPTARGAPSVLDDASSVRPSLAGESVGEALMQALAARPSPVRQAAPNAATLSSAGPARLAAAGTSRVPAVRTPSIFSAAPPPSVTIGSDLATALAQSQQLLAILPSPITASHSSVRSPSNEGPDRLRQYPSGDTRSSSFTDGSDGVVGFTGLRGADGGSSVAATDAGDDDEDHKHTILSISDDDDGGGGRGTPTVQSAAAIPPGADGAQPIMLSSLTMADFRRLQETGEILGTAPRPARKDKYSGFIIACHNSAGKINMTIEKLLMHVEPWQIFVADNGSTPQQVQATEFACEVISEQYRLKYPDYVNEGNINFGSIREGSKTMAQFCTAYNILATHPHIKYVTMLDDDTLVPDSWNEDDVIALFEKNPDTAGIAYPLRASNRQHLWAQFQDLEYLTAGYMKIAQARAGSALFASGAINTWRVDVIVDILFRHDTMHHGDDLQQGLLLHSLRGKEWFIKTKEHEVHSQSYKVDVYEVAVTATDVPVHWIHWHDWWPKRFIQHAPKRCDCGEPSLFIQRAKGWDLSRQRFLFKYLKMIMSHKAWRSWRGFWVRLVGLHDVYLILNDWIGLGYLIYLFCILENYLPLFHAILVIWAFQLLIFQVFTSIRLYTVGLYVPPEVIVFFSVYKIPMIGLRLYAMFYNVLYYVPFVRNKKMLKKRIRSADKSTLENIRQMPSTWSFMGDLIIEDDDRPDNWSVDTEFQRNARNRQPSAGTTYMPEIRQGVLPPFQASFFVQGKFTPVDLQQPPPVPTEFRPATITINDSYLPDPLETVFIADRVRQASAAASPAVLPAPADPIVSAPVPVRVRQPSRAQSIAHDAAAGDDAASFVGTMTTLSTASESEVERRRMELDVDLDLWHHLRTASTATTPARTLPPLPADLPPSGPITGRENILAALAVYHAEEEAQLPESAVLAPELDPATGEFRMLTDPDERASAPSHWQHLGRLVKPAYKMPPTYHEFLKHKYNDYRIANGLPPIVNYELGSYEDEMETRVLPDGRRFLDVAILL